MYHSLAPAPISTPPVNGAAATGGKTWETERQAATEVEGGRAVSASRENVMVEREQDRARRPRRQQTVQPETLIPHPKTAVGASTTRTSHQTLDRTGKTRRRVHRPPRRGLKERNKTNRTVKLTKHGSRRLKKKEVENMAPPSSGRKNSTNKNDDTRPAHARSPAG